MDYHELINELSNEDNPCVLDYIDDAVEMLEHLYSELKAANARCETLNKMVTQYQDELIPGYRERAEKAEAQLSQYTASGLEPCDYAAMRSALDGEKQAKQSLSEALCALAESNVRAEKAERERDAAVSELEAIMAYGTMYNIYGARGAYCDAEISDFWQRWHSQKEG